MVRFYGVWFWALRSPLQTSVHPERGIIGNGDAIAMADCCGAYNVLVNVATIRSVSERTIAGLECAEAQGRVGGRPKAEDSEPKLVAKIGRLRSQGKRIRAIAIEVRRSPNTVLRLPKAAE